MSLPAPYDVEPEWSPERKEAFALYRDFGPERSLRAVAGKLRKSETLINRWSMEDKWIRRVSAWDMYQDKLRQAAASAERERIGKAHARTLDTTIDVLLEPALELERRIKSGEVDLSNYTPAQLLEMSTVIGRVLPRLVVASRLVHGMSTEKVEDLTSDAMRSTAAASIDELDTLLTGIEDGAAFIVDKTQKQLPAST